jgi:hypothetical protein
VAFLVKTIGFKPLIEKVVSWRASSRQADVYGRKARRADASTLPILADALQDAGCDNDDVLSHCRGPGPHFRGCWVVDLVLGKK